MTCQPCLGIPKDLLPHLVDIQEAALVKQGPGTQKKYPPDGGSTVYSKEPCLIEPLGTDKVIEHMKLGFNGTHRIYFQRKLTLTKTMRAVYGARKFELTGEQDVAELGKLYIVDAEEVK